MNDEDGDMQPGQTFNVMVDAAKWVFRVTQEERLRLLNGYRVGEHLYADREFGETTKVLACTLEGRPTRIEDCPLGRDRPCPSIWHKVELVPLLSNHGCREVIEREQGWFNAAKPEFPAACPGQLSGTP